MNKVPCPSCGELNYDNVLVCWACGKPMRAPAAGVEPATLPAAPPAPPAEPPAPAPEPPAPSPVAPPSGDRRPAEIEAASLTDKPFVTPPVEVVEMPRTPGEWLAYIGHLATGSVSGFREALNEYDRRRGRPSGVFSSASCLALALAFLFIAALMAWLTPMLLRK